MGEIISIFRGSKNIIIFQYQETDLNNFLHILKYLSGPGPFFFSAYATRRFPQRIVITIDSAKEGQEVGWI